MTYREELVQVAAVALAALQCSKNGTSALLGAADYNIQDELIREVLDERERQERKWGEQSLSPERWHTILSEEVGEVARSILEGD